MCSWTITQFYIIHSNHRQLLPPPEGMKALCDQSDWVAFAFNCLRFPCSCPNVITRAICCLLSPVTLLQLVCSIAIRTAGAGLVLFTVLRAGRRCRAKRLWHSNRWRLLTKALQGHSLPILTGGAAWRNSEEKQQDEQRIPNQWSYLCYFHCSCHIFKALEVMLDCHIEA